MSRRLLVSKLEHLQYVYLDNNNLHRIHLTAFDGTSLRVLHLQNNMLNFGNYGEENWNTENASPFQTLHQLQELNMRNNSMTTFLHDWHTSNLALRDLDLSHNNIEMIDFRFIFNKWTHSIRINVSHNNIHSFNTAPNFIQMENESHVVWILNNNPLHCDCLLIHFAHTLQIQSLNSEKNHGTQFITDALKCSTPKRFADQSLESIQLTDFTCNLNRTQCPDRCSCYVRTFDATTVFNCSNANLTKMPDIPKTISSYLGLKLQLVELHIENNNITSLKSDNSTGYKNVNFIYAKNNLMENITAEHLPDNLFALDLSVNRLKRISLNALDKLNHMKNLQNITFDENQWICDCAAYESMKTIKNQFAEIVNVNDFTCDNDKSMTMFNANALCPTDWKPALIIMITFVALISIFTTFFYKNRHEIMIWLFANNATWFFGKQTNVDCHKEFDAFIWYATLDEKFVADDLMPQLENMGPKSLKICLLVREMQGGDVIPQQVFTFFFYLF